jgi:hypothetical protein
MWPSDSRRLCGCRSDRLWPTLHRIHADEAGNLSIITLLVLFGFVLLIAGLFNVAVTAQHKLEQQNAADAIARSSGTKLARAMNAVTAANHLLGEMHALIVMHAALGGKPLETGGGGDLTPGPLQQRVRQAVQRANLYCPESPKPTAAFVNRVTAPVTVAGAIGDSKHQLQRVAVQALRVHAMGGFLHDFLGKVPYIGPFARAVGRIALRIAIDYERQVLFEYRTLDAMQMLAEGPLRAGRIALTQLRTALHQVTRGFADEANRIVDDTAATLGDNHGVDGTVYYGTTQGPDPTDQALPVVPEPLAQSPSALQKSQLVRATVPWLHYWRLPLLQLGQDSLRLARFSSYYVQHTQDEVLEQTRQAQQHGVRLLILRDFRPATMKKGTEPWATVDGSRLADRRFAVVGLAYRATRPQMATPYFRRNPDHGSAAFAQAMIYNANPQNPAFDDPLRQREVGFDTLNWLGQRIPEWGLGVDPDPTGRTPVSYFRERAPQPSIRLHWQTLLTPCTRIAETSEQQTGPLGRLLQRIPVDRPIARLH